MTLSIITKKFHRAFKEHKCIDAIVEAIPLFGWAINTNIYVIKIFIFTDINLKKVVVAQYYKKGSVLVLVFIQQVNNLSWFIPIFFLPSIDKLFVCITVHNYP